MFRFPLQCAVDNRPSHQYGSAH